MTLLPAALTTDELRRLAQQVDLALYDDSIVRTAEEYLIECCIRFLAAVAERQEPVAKIVRNATGQIRIVDNEENSFDMSKFVGASFFLHPAQQPTGVGAFRHKETGEVRYVLTNIHNEDDWEDVLICPMPPMGDMK